MTLSFFEFMQCNHLFFFENFDIIIKYLGERIYYENYKQTT